jgi:GMP synthase-like glutamine amidotransferase
MFASSMSEFLSLLTYTESQFWSLSFHPEVTQSFHPLRLLEKKTSTKHMGHPGLRICLPMASPLGCFHVRAVTSSQLRIV